MPKIERQVREWVAAGVISPESAQHILEYEVAKPQNKWILYGLVILGAFVFGIGIISTIAANWENIPGSVKLAGQFLVLSAIALAIIRSWTRNQAVAFDVLLFFLNLFCLASIGLISQVFHTGGKIYQALALWSVITLPTALVSRRMFLPFFWLGGATIATIVAAGQLNLFYLDPVAPHALSSALTLLLATLALISQNLTGNSGWSRALRSWVFIVGLSAALANEFLQSDRTSMMDYTLWSHFQHFGTSYVLWALTAVLVWRQTHLKAGQKWLLNGILLLFFVPLHSPQPIDLSSIASDRLIFPFFNILLLGALALYFGSVGSKRLFQFFLALVGIRFLIFYFDAFKGLLSTGLGLMFSGALILGIAIAWQRHSASWANQVERWLK